MGVGVAAGAGGIGQSFLVSNRFSDVDPELSQGTLCLGGALDISSSDGGLDPSFGGLVVGHGTSANCPIANLYTIISIDSAMALPLGVWVLTVASKGVGAVEVWVGGVGLVSTFALYLLFGNHGPFSLIRHICFGSWGFAKHWVGAWLGWL